MIKTNKDIFIFWGLSILIVLLSFPHFDAQFGSGIDESLIWVYNHLIDKNPKALGGIHFPHGPLACLLYPIGIANNLEWSLSIHVVLMLFIAFVSFLVYNHDRPVISYGTPLLVCLIVFHKFGLEQLILSLVMLLLALYSQRRNFYLLLVITTLCVFAFYLKIYVGMISALFLFSGLCSFILFNGMSLWLAGRLLLFYLGGICLIWFLWFSNLSGFYHYFIGLISLGNDNSSAVSLYPDQPVWPYFLIWISLLTIPFFNRSVPVRMWFVTILPAFFAAWKHGIARQDVSHGSTFLLFLFVIFIPPFLQFKIKKISFSLHAFIIFSLFFFSFQSYILYEPFTLNAFQPFKSLADFSHLADVKKNGIEQSLRNISHLRLKDSIRSIIGQHTVDIYPWNYAFVPANQLNWKPRPVIQSYAAYTSFLDQRNADYFESSLAPEFIIWHNENAHLGSVNNPGLSSIDGRFVLNDEPKTIRMMMKNYQKIYSDSMITLLRKEPVLNTCKLFDLDTNHTKWNEWVSIPPNISGLWAFININRSFKGSLLSFIYKDTYYQIELDFKDGHQRLYRVVPKNSRDGLYISPLFTNRFFNVTDTPIRFRLRCADESMVEDEIKIMYKFFQCRSRVLDSATDTSF